MNTLNNSKDSGYNLDINSQIEMFKKIIMKNEILSEVFTKAPQLVLEDYYIGAGSLVQTVWNQLSGFPLSYGIGDIDIVYFDKNNMSYSEEDLVIQKANSLFNDIPIIIDVKNQAMVHLWYEKHFGYEITPYTSVESAINTWPTTASSIGARIERNGEWKVYAPFGLNDLFGKIVRPNKAQITKEIYEKKVAKWSKNWTDLIIIPWD